MGQTDTRRRPQQKRSLEKVERILDVVESLAASGEIDAITTTQIAASTGLAVGTIYQYFSHRNDLLMAAHDRIQERLVAEVVEYVIPPDLVPGDIEKVTRLYVEKARSFPGYLSLHKFAHTNQSLENAGGKLEATIGEMVDSIVRAAAPQAGDVRIEICKTVIVNLFSVLTDAVLLEADDYVSEHLLRELVAHCLFALDQTALPQDQS